MSLQAENELADYKQYSVGDEVLILDHTTPIGTKAKLRRHWIGPFVINKVTGPLSYVVASQDGLKQYRVYAAHVKPIYKSRYPTVWPLDSPASAPGVSSKASSPGSYAAKPVTSITVLRQQCPIPRGGEDVVCYNEDKEQ